MLPDKHGMAKRQCWHSAEAQWPGDGDTFCSVRNIKRGSGALVNTEERNSTRRQKHGSARDNVISALLGPLLSTTRCSTEIIVWGERGDAEETLHLPHGASFLSNGLPEEVTHWQFFNACASHALDKLCHCPSSQVRLLRSFLRSFLSVTQVQVLT